MSMSVQGKKVVVALGGNAITREFEEGDIYQQFANTRKALAGVVELAAQGCKIVITHGNGPQVGNALIRVEESRHLVPPVPLGVIVADLEGGMGYMIEQTMQNKLMARKIDRPVVTILSQVIVDKNDPSILNPTKFVGPFYKQDDIARLQKTRGYIIKKDANRGYRRVVPSPRPRRFINAGIINRLVEEGIIVLAAGGGGIPVYIENDGRYEGVDGVVDKDLASSVLAQEIGAQMLFILTAVEKVALNFGSPQQQFLDVLTLEQARKYLQEGQFPQGSMGPKIEAAIDFLTKGGEQVIICAVEGLTAAISGATGTRIVP